jgi:hypothetical protein
MKKRDRWDEEFPTLWTLVCSPACVGLAFFVLVASAARLDSADAEAPAQTSRLAPTKLSPPSGGFVTILADGRWMAWSVKGKRNADNIDVINDTSVAQQLMTTFSTDEGITWSERKASFQFPQVPGMHWPEGPSFVDRAGVVHLFGLHYFGLGPAGFYDWKNAKSLVSHLMSTDGGKTWGHLGHCDFGALYTGAVNGAAQLTSGRILVPISYYSRRPTGKHVSRVSISDDGGKSWRPSRGECVVDTGGHLMEGGAIEPASTQLRDGRVLMLMRTQGGYLYESFSSDEGETWTEPAASRFVSSNSPAALLPLRDGRLVLVWNNCMTPYHEGGVPTSYGRQVLAIAISADDGKTWHGYREVDRVTGRGAVGYPFLNECPNGDVLVQGGGLYRVPPAWLMEKKFREHFKHGLDDWMTLESEGVSVAPHPSREGAFVMALAKPHAQLPAAASLNFPFGIRGQMKLRVMLKPNDAIMMRQHVYFCLTDFFCMPRLPEVVPGRPDGWGVLPVGGVYPEGGRFKFRVAPDGEVSIATRSGLFQDEFMRTSAVLQAGKWHTITLDWDCERQSCTFSLDNDRVANLPQLSRAGGLCYLRLWMNVEASAPETLLIESVEVEVEP